MNTTKLVAHRGDNTNYPENSYAGIEAALKAGARFVEFDIQMNKDGSLVVIHDDSFKRTANIDLSLFEVSDDDMSQISVHEPERFKNNHFPTPVPFLSDIMKLLKSYPQSKALVEIKNESINHWGLEKVMKGLLDTLKDSISQSIIIAYSSDALAYTQKNSKHLTGLVFNQYSKTIKKTADQLEPDFMICPHDIIPQNPIKEKVWQGGWQWMVYSINNKSLVEKFLLREDVDLVETDDINLMLGKS